MFIIGLGFTVVLRAVVVASAAAAAETPLSDAPFLE